jgi:hypothetical protein
MSHARSLLHTHRSRTLRRGRSRASTVDNAVLLCPTSSPPHPHRSGAMSVACDSIAAAVPRLRSRKERFCVAIIRVQSIVYTRACVHTRTRTRTHAHTHTRTHTPQERTAALHRCKLNAVVKVHRNVKHPEPNSGPLEVDQRRGIAFGVPTDRTDIDRETEQRDIET